MISHVNSEFSYKDSMFVVAFNPPNLPAPKNCSMRIWQYIVF